MGTGAESADTRLHFVTVVAQEERVQEGKARAMLAAAAPGDDDDQEALGRKLLHSIQGVKRRRRSWRPRLGMRRLWRD